MKGLVSFMLCYVLSVSLISCGNGGKTIKKETVSPKYKIGQYVYIHGVVKGLVRDNTGSDCGCDGVKQYTINVIAPDGGDHAWYFNDYELSPTHDTVIVRYVVDSDMISKDWLSKKIDTLQMYSRLNMNEDMKFKKEIKQALTGLQNTAKL